MKLRYHLLILAAIAVATVIWFPMPFFLTVLFLLGEGAIYGYWVIPMFPPRQLQAKKRRGRLDR